ncbi:MAG: hypothetical protein H7Y17_16280, partial [Chlorobia bacterium]|nr:hypothetical protein [Fimbriimonadaceae bacterium]
SSEEVFVKIMASEVLSNKAGPEKQEFRAKLMPAFVQEYENLTLARKLDRTLAIPRVVDLGFGSLQPGHAATVPFIVYELLDGHTIADLGESQRDRLAWILNPTEFVARVGKIIDTLAKLHSMRILHGDVHPGNIMQVRRDDDEELILIDFGQSFLLDGFLAKTLHDKGSSNPYTAPERLVRLTNGPVWQGQADIYSLGATILSLLTGCMPQENLRTSGGIEGDRTAYIDALIEESNSPVCKTFPGLAQIISKATEPALDRRYQSMMDLQADWRVFTNREIDLLPARENVNMLRSHYRTIQNNPNPLHCLVSQDFDELCAKVTNLERGSEYIETGTRNDIIQKLSRLILLCKANDEVIENTGSYCWHSENLGKNGRYHAAVKMAAMSGVRIQRNCDVSSTMGSSVAWNAVRMLSDGTNNMEFTDTDMGWPEDVQTVFHGLMINFRSLADPLVIELRFELTLATAERTQSPLIRGFRAKCSRMTDASIFA